MSEEELEASVAKVASLPTLAGSEADADGELLVDMSKSKRELNSDLQILICCVVENNV